MSNCSLVHVGLLCHTAPLFYSLEWVVVEEVSYVEFVSSLSTAFRTCSTF